jgi:hypothetical protein
VPLTFARNSSTMLVVMFAIFGSSLLVCAPVSARLRFVSPSRNQSQDPSRPSQATLRMLSKFSNRCVVPAEGDGH